MIKQIAFSAALFVLGAIPALSFAEAGGIESVRIFGVPLDPGVLNRVLVSPYGAAGISFPWGALNFTGTPETNVRFTGGAGVRVAYPVVWFGGVIGGFEYMARPVSKTNRYPGLSVTETRDLRLVSMLLGWRQYAWCFYYGTGIFAGVAAGPWRTRLEVNGTGINFGPLGPSRDDRRGFTFGLYTEIGIMIPVAERVTIDVTAQLQGSVIDTRMEGNPFGRSDCRPMALLLIAGATFRV
ncbi:MAG: hypothetical protein JW838_01405 [Spirochaetes bacterium]|nr:hypothetical protein [Spirochaetota bacterium]